MKRKIRFLVGEAKVYLGNITGEEGHYAEIEFITGPADRPDHTLRLHFIGPEDESPKTTRYGYDSNRKIGWVDLPVEQFSWYMELLRNSERIWVVLNRDDPRRHNVQTTIEL